MIDPNFFDNNSHPDTVRIKISFRFIKKIIEFFKKKKKKK